MTRRRSDYDIYLDWLDETVELLHRLRAESKAAPANYTVAELADELRAIADKVDEKARHLRGIADALQHVEHQLEQGAA